MAAEQITPAEYMDHHLTFFNVSVGQGSFWSLNVDTIITSVILGFVGLGFIWWVVRGATSGVPSKRQALVEIFVDFIDVQVKDIFHHADRHRFVAPLALTVGLWVLLMNAMDFLPADIMTWISKLFGAHYFRFVPTADVNTTFALSLSVWILMIGFAIRTKGLGGFIHELVCTPFGSFFLLWPLNLLFNIVEYISKPLSHSLRLYREHVRGRGHLPAALDARLCGGRWRHRCRLPGRGMVHLPHPHRPPSGLHLHDAHRGLHRHGAREPLRRPDSISLHPK